VKEKFTTNPQEVSDLSAGLAFESHHAPQHGRNNQENESERTLKSHKATFFSHRRPIRPCSTHARIRSVEFPGKSLRPGEQNESAAASGLNHR
jgi:hypothetical protein